MNWQSEAKRAANHAGNEMFEAHRGAIEWSKGVVAMFANDGEPQEMIDGVTAKCKAAGVEILTSAICDDEYSAAVLVKHKSCGDLHDLVWTEWQERTNPPAGFVACQRGIALGVVCGE
jgi:hypothetical protein